MYKVKEWHFRPTYRKGDLEDEHVLINVEVFKTRKSAKAYIESRLSGKPKAYRQYHKGKCASYCGYYTGKTWVNENTGDTCEESFTFELSIIKPC